MVGLDYFKLTLKHKWYVFRAGLKVKVSFIQLFLHDFSKLGRFEYPRYQKGFFEDKDEKSRNIAWLSHQKKNKHHWEYWITLTPHRIGVSGEFDPQPMPMPEKYVREMVADWMGASLAYTGKSDIQEWVNANHHKMLLHEETEMLLGSILREQGLHWPIIAASYMISLGKGG